MNGKLFLGTARLLLRNGSDEAAYRSAVSRAYYACFIATRDLAWNTYHPKYRIKTGIRKADKLGHEQLLKYLKNGPKNVQLLYQDLNSLRGNRIDADYKMSKNMTIDDARGAIEEAEATLELLSRTPKEEIRNAMEDYLDKITQTFN